MLPVVQQHLDHVLHGQHTSHVGSLGLNLQTLDNNVTMQHVSDTKTCASCRPAAP
jgi:hypothetical protein